MGSRRRRGGGGTEKKGVKNVGAEETGGKNRAVSTEAAGVCREGTKGRKMERRGREEGEGVEREEWVVVGERKKDSRQA